MIMHRPPCYANKLWTWTRSSFPFFPFTSSSSGVFFKYSARRTRRKNSNASGNIDKFFFTIRSTTVLTIRVLCNDPLNFFHYFIELCTLDGILRFSKSLSSSSKYSEERSYKVCFKKYRTIFVRFSVVLKIEVARSHNIFYTIFSPFYWTLNVWKFLKFP